MCATPALAKVLHAQPSLLPCRYNPAAAAWLAKSENTDVLGVIQTFFTKVEHQGLRLSSAKLLSALVHQQSHEVA